MKFKESSVQNKSNNGTKQEKNSRKEESIKNNMNSNPPDGGANFKKELIDAVKEGISEIKTSLESIIKDGLEEIKNGLEKIVKDRLKTDKYLYYYNLTIIKA